MQGDEVGRPGHHLVGGTAGEGEQQDALGSCSSLDERRHPRHQGPGLARPRPGHHDQRVGTVGGYGELSVIEALVPGEGGASGGGEHMFVC